MKNLIKIICVTIVLGITGMGQLQAVNTEYYIDNDTNDGRYYNAMNGVWSYQWNNSRFYNADNRWTATNDGNQAYSWRVYNGATNIFQASAYINDYAATGTAKYICGGTYRINQNTASGGWNLIFMSSSPQYNSIKGVYMAPYSNWDKVVADCVYVRD